MQQLRTIDSAGGLVMPNGIWAVPPTQPAPYRPVRLTDPERRLTLGALRALTSQQDISIGASSAGAIVGALTAAGLVAGPVGAAIGAGIGLVATLISSLFQPNLQKIQASNDANQIEAILQQNLANWLSIPATQRYASVQQAALGVFTQGWAQYTQLVQPDLAKAPDSISDRQQGACVYHTAECAGWNNGVYTPNGPNQSTGCCWNWFVGYYLPILNDPNVQPDPADGSDGGASSGSSSGTGGSGDSSSLSPSTLLLIGAGLLALAVLA